LGTGKNSQTAGNLSNGRNEKQVIACGIRSEAPTAIADTYLFVSGS